MKPRRFRLYLTIVYPSGTVVEREINAWQTYLTALDQRRPAFEEVWLCEGQEENTAGCDVTADRILIWERT